jgi:hypothetical protein
MILNSNTHPQKDVEVVSAVFPFSIEHIFENAGI